MHKINIDTKSPQLLKIQSISDDRGYLIPFTDHIDHELFHRCYVVGDYGKGVIRGLHYHKQEMKIFTIVSGAAKFVTIKIPEDMADRNDTKEILGTGTGPDLKQAQHNSAYNALKKLGLLK